MNIFFKGGFSVFLYLRQFLHRILFIMQRFKNILIVLTHNELHEDVFRYAAMITSQSEAHITFAVMHPALSADMNEIEETYHTTLTDKIRQKSAEYNLNPDAPILFEHQEPYFVAITKMVLKDQYDLIIKAVEDVDKGGQYKGLKSLDMSLLRKCPCPIWLCRPLQAKESYMRVLTAIDPSSEGQNARDLSVKLMTIGESIAQHFGASHEIITCWEYELEDFLRYSAFGRTPSAQVDETIQQAEGEHKAAMHALLNEAGLSDTKVTYERGQAEDCVPRYVQDHEIDIVVMGTVARTGIEGFLIGNTAENIIQNLSCSLFTAKPDGFVSPIKV